MLIAILARCGVPESIRKPLAWATTIIAVLGLLWLVWTLWVGAHDRRVIADDRAAANVEKAQAVTKADREANAKADVRDKALATTEKELNDAAKKGDDTIVGPGSAGVYDRLRDRKAD